MLNMADRDALTEQLKSLDQRFGRLHEGAMAWQRRLESKVDTLLARCSGTEAFATTPRIPVVDSFESATVLPGKVQPAWPGDDSHGCAPMRAPPAMPKQVFSDVKVESRTDQEELVSPVVEGGGNGVGKRAGVEGWKSKTSKTQYDLGSRKLSGIKQAVPLAKKKTQKADHYILSQRRSEVADAQSTLVRIVTDRSYEVAAVCLILLNSFCIGWQVQVVAQRVNDSFFSSGRYDTKAPVFFVVAQTVFGILFAVDLALRWASEGLFEFFTETPDLAWNVFDTVTVLSSVVEVTLELIVPASMTVASISVIRVLRVLRLFRLVKVIRIYPFFHELRMMIESCLNSLKSYLWCIMVLFLMTYIFGIFITTGACTYLADKDRKVGISAEVEDKNLHKFFGSVDRSMLSLFQTITGGRDWCEFYQVLLLLDVTKRWIFLLYTSFATFAVCNVVAAVFVESAMQSSALDRETLIREQLRDSQAYQQKMLVVFEEMDADGTGTICLDEFLTHLNDDRVVAYFNSLKLDVSDATSLFKLLDVDRSGSVEIMEFIEGCQKLKGESRTLDMHLMRYELHNMRYELHELARNFGVLDEENQLPSVTRGQ